jgi:formylglycine-generating enzyme required for sulfatase activity
MPLNKKQFQQIHDALLDGYNEFNLRQMVLFGLGEALDRIAGGSTLDERVFNLVEWADLTGRERELVEKAYSHNPTNLALQKLYNAWFVLQPPEDLSAASETNPPQIFLSYSRKDSAQMQQVLRLLEGAGLSVWTDEGLEPGTERWHSTVEEAIHRTECTVVLLSPDAKQSRRVGIEVSFAQALGRRIFPVLLRGNQVESVPLRLFDAQYLDARQSLADAVSQRLLPVLRRHLNLVGTAPKPIDDEQAVSESREREAPKPAKEESAEISVQQIPVDQENRKLEEVSTVAVGESPTPVSNTSPEKSRPTPIESLPTRAWQVLYGVGIVLSLVVVLVVVHTIYSQRDQPAAAQATFTPEQLTSIMPTALAVSVAAAQATFTPEQLTSIMPTALAVGVAAAQATFTPEQLTSIMPTALAVSVASTATFTATPIPPTPTPTETPTPTLTPPSGVDTVEEILIPAGAFQMGCDVNNPVENGCKVNSISELPLHTVYLDAYYIDKYEVTNARYKACVDAGGCRSMENVDSATRSFYYGDAAYDNYPVININWDQANAFCVWAGKRLPTEAEWQKAARGSSDTGKYPWGDDDPSRILLNHDFKIGDTTAVGSYPDGASPYGVMDMAGNVREWLNDWYQEDYYSVSPDSNPQGPARGNYRMLQGGSWSNGDYNVRLARRGNNHTGYWSNNVGFRCVRSP